MKDLVWESAMSASHLKLDNLIVILDNNGFQQTGKNQEIMNLKNLSSKWKSFGWDVETVDGHDIKKLTKVFKENKENKPKIIIAKTIKGKGFSFSDLNYAGIILGNEITYDKALKELKY